MTVQVADTWFETHSLADGVTLIWEPHVSPDVRCNIWHVRGRDRDLLFDSGMGVASLRAHLPLVTEKPLLCVASHSHFDHVGGHHEFAERLIHAAEADILSAPTADNTVASAYVTPEIFNALPYAGFDARDYAIEAAPPTRLLHDRDVVDLGDRSFEVRHLPGHSPGCIVLWEAATGTLFSGDVIYDGELYDHLYHSVIDDYVASLERLKAIPAETVHGGHYASFGRARMIELADDYIAGKRAPGCPAENAGRRT